MFSHFGNSALARSRWAGIGAAIAVSLGAGGIGLIAHAASATPSSFVAIAPCRLFDTRPSTVVGDRVTPLTAGEELDRQVSGTNGNCTIPSTATAISYNLTIPTSIDGFLTLFPADAARPSSSSINPVAGEKVKANSGIVGLSATGAIKLYTLTGPVDALLDITGYFVAGAGGAGVAGSPGADGAPGARGLSAWDVVPSGQTVTGTYVYDTHSGTDTLSDAIAFDLPGVAPVELTDETVNFDVNSGAGDADSECDGLPEAPTAPAGKVCIYAFSVGGLDLATLQAFPGILPTRSIFITFDPSGLLDDDEFVYFSWAYTAP
jgi:hypothetical protein